MQTLPATRSWFERDDWGTGADQRGLSVRQRELVDTYRRDGYLVVEDARVLDELDVDGIWTRLAAAFNADGSGRVQDAWQHDAAVRSITTHPAVLDVLQMLYGREPIPFQTLNFLSGTEQRTTSPARSSCRNSTTNISACRPSSGNRIGRIRTRARERLQPH